jgi:hypothetical protein
MTDQEPTTQTTEEPVESGALEDEDAAGEPAEDGETDGSE